MHFSKPVHLVNVLSGKDCANSAEHVLVCVMFWQDPFGEKICQEAKPPDTQRNKPRFIKKCYEKSEEEVQDENFVNDLICMQGNIPVYRSEFFGIYGMLTHWISASFGERTHLYDLVASSLKKGAAFLAIKESNAICAKLLFLSVQYRARL